MQNLEKFIECYITGIVIDRVNKFVIISIQDSKGENWTLEGVDVADFMVLQMSMVNIIDRISIWNHLSNIDEYRNKVFALLNGKIPAEAINLDSPLINQIVEKIKLEEFILIEFEPVYGALVLMLAKTFTIKQINCFRHDET